MESQLIDNECDICYESTESFPMPCCQDKFICSPCLTKLSNKSCPYCRKTVNIETHVNRLSNIPNVNYNQFAKVVSMLVYIVTSFACIFLMGYGLETGMNEMSMFIIDMIIFILLNICHIGIWNVTVTQTDGTQTIMADQFGYKYYLGGILQNTVYIFFWFYFNNHFFLNSMTFIILCYNFALYPLYNGMKCMWDQCSKIMYYQEETIVDNVTYNSGEVSRTAPQLTREYDSDGNREPANFEYRDIAIMIDNDE